MCIRDSSDTAEDVVLVPVPPPRGVDVEAGVVDPVDPAAIPAAPMAVPAAPAAVPAAPAAVPADLAAVPEDPGAVAPPDIPFTTRSGRVSRPPDRLDL